jgi:hypothetical protein
MVSYLLVAPAIVLRGYGVMGREDFQGQVAAGWLGLQAQLGR